MADIRLDKAIAELDVLASVSDDDMEELEDIDDAIRALKAKTDSFYSDNRELSDADIEELLGEYENLLNSCNEFIKQGKDLTGIGKGRLHCVNAIRALVTEDMRSLNEAGGLSQKGRTLRRVIQEGRSITASVNEGEEIKTVGGQMNSRIPVKLTLEDGSEEEGFFTENNQSKGVEKILEDIVSENAARYGDDSFEAKIARNVCSFKSRNLTSIYSSVKDRLEEFLKSDDLEESLEDYDKTFSLLGPFLNMLDGAVKDELRKQENKELRRYCLNLINDTLTRSITGMVNTEFAKIPEGEGIDKRNTAMSTVANYLGMGSLIAGARSFTLKTAEGEKKGTFQQKAKGKNFDNLLKDDPAWEIAQYPGFEDMEHPAVKQQLADLQVLDYLCGNIDRHASNMLYKVEKVKGKTMITGIMGIDNDMSFGTIDTAANNAGEKMVNPENMRVMRADTARKILDMTPESLDLMLADMNFTGPEMDAAKTRLNKLQEQIKAGVVWEKGKGAQNLQFGKILLVPDSEFAKLSLKDLAKSAPDVNSTNYFNRFASNKKYLLDKYLAGDFGKPEAEIRYANAKAEKGLLNFTNVTVPENIDLTVTAQRVAEAKKYFDEMGGKWYGKNTEHYEWMKKSVNRMSEYFDTLKQQYPDQTTVKIPAADAIKLDAFFRQIRMAGENYVKTHENPWTPQGIKRKKMGMAMSELRIQEAAVPENAVPENAAPGNENAPEKRSDSVNVKPSNLDKLIDEEKQDNPDNPENEPAKKKASVKKRSKSVNLGEPVKKGPNPPAK